MPALAPDLGWVLAVLRRRWRLIALCAVVATGLTAWVAFREPKTYRAKAVIRLVDNRQAVAGRMGSSPAEMLQGRSVDPLLSLAQVLTSRRVAGVVIDSVPVLRLRAEGLPTELVDSLRLDPGIERDSFLLRFGADSFSVQFQDQEATAAYRGVASLPRLALSIEAPPGVPEIVAQVRGREGVIDGFTSGLRVSPRENTDVADVYYYSSDPPLARRVVNQAVRTFQQINTQASRQESSLRREFLEEQLQENDAQLLEAQRELSAFRANAQFYSSRERLSAEQSALASMGVRRQELQASLQAYRSALGDLDGAGPVNLGGLLGTPEAGQNPVLNSQQARMAQLQLMRDSLTAGPYGRVATDPDVRRVDTLLAQARNDLRGTVAGIIASTEARIEGIDELQGRNADAFRRISGQEVTEAQLVLQVQALTGLSNQLREEYQRARIAEAVEVGQVEILDLAVTPDDPIGTSPKRRTVFGLLVGLLAGTGLAVLLEQLNTSIRRRGQLQQSLSLPELGVVPRGSRGVHSAPSRLRLGRGSAHPVTGRTAVLPLVALDLQSGGAEAYRLIRTNLLFLGEEGRLRTLMVTSAAPGDGKTTVSTNLAATFAKQGIRVLLVDCDLRRGRLHDVFGVPRRPGLSEVLQERLALMDAVHPTEVENLSVVTMGTPPAQPAELQGSARMQDVVAEGREAFDLVILDTPPVLSTADASILGALAEAVVLVVRPGRTDQSEAQAAMEQLQQVGANVVGAVLNDQDAQVEGREHYYYASYYGPPGS